MTRPNAFTQKPDLTKFIKAAQISERGRQRGIELSGKTTAPFQPRTPGVKRGVRAQT